MKTLSIVSITLIAASLATSAALARGPGGNGNAGRPNRACSTQICPNGNEPGSRQGAYQQGVGKASRAGGNRNANGTPVRDGSGRVRAPGNGAKDGTGNNPRHPTMPASE